jgi:hypothetical protein
MPAKGDSLWFYYYANRPGPVKIEIFNLIGEKGITLEDYADAAGYRRTCWDIRRVAAGIYFYRISLPGLPTTDLHKLVVTK